MSSYHINNSGPALSTRSHAREASASTAPAAAASASLSNYSRSVSASYDHYDYLCKLLVIGDSGCGKSSLLKRFSDDEFHLTYSSTIGVDFEVRTVDVGAQKVKMQMWDTAGQERFRTITSSYYRGAHAVLIVCDVTQESSFAHVTKWIQELSAVHKDGIGHADSPQILLVANKTDLVSQRVVEKHRIEALAEELGVPFLETSAKLNSNVAKAFHDVAAAFVEQRKLQEKAGGRYSVGGPGGKFVKGISLEEEDDDQRSGWKKCFGACSVQ